MSAAPSPKPTIGHRKASTPSGDDDPLARRKSKKKAPQNDLPVVAAEGGWTDADDAAYMRRPLPSQAAPATSLSTAHLYAKSAALVPKWAAQTLVEAARGREEEVTPRHARRPAVKAQRRPSGESLSAESDDDDAVQRVTGPSDGPAAVEGALLRTILASDQPLAVRSRSMAPPSTSKHISDEEKQSGPRFLCHTNVAIKHGPILDMAWLPKGDMLLAAHEGGKHRHGSVVTLWQAGADRLQETGRLFVGADSSSGCGDPIRQIVPVPSGDAVVALHDSQGGCPSLLMLDLGSLSVAAGGRQDESANFQRPLSFLSQVFRESPFRVQAARTERRRSTMTTTYHQPAARKRIAAYTGGKGGMATASRDASDTILRFCFNGTTGTAGGSHDFALTTREAAWLGSLHHGSLYRSILPPAGGAGGIVDVAWASADELVVATDQGVYLYDVRRVGPPVRRFGNDGTLVTAVTAFSGNLAIGYQSGAVDIYCGALSVVGGGTRETLSNLRTEVDMIDFGAVPSSVAESSSATKLGVLFGSSLQVQGVRYATLPGFRVARDFPSTSQRSQRQLLSGKGFTTAIACSKQPTAPLFAMCEDRKDVTLFAASA